MARKTSRRKGESMQKCVSRKVRANKKEGRKQKQAVAISLSQCGAKRRQKRK